MITKQLLQFIVNNANKNNVLLPLVEHLRLTMDEQKFNRVLEMLISSDENFKDTFDITHKDIDFHKVETYINNLDKNKRVIDIKNIDVDIIERYLVVKYSYACKRWYKTEECTGNWSYRENDEHHFSKFDIEYASETTDVIDYEENDVFINY